MIFLSKNFVLSLGVEFVIRKNFSAFELYFLIILDGLILLLSDLDILRFCLLRIKSCSKIVLNGFLLVNFKLKKYILII